MKDFVKNTLKTWITKNIEENHKFNNSVMEQANSFEAEIKQIVEDAKYNGLPDIEFGSKSIKNNTSSYVIKYKTYDGLQKTINIDLSTPTKEKPFYVHAVEAKTKDQDNFLNMTFRKEQQNDTILDGKETLNNIQEILKDDIERIPTYKIN